MNPTLTRVSPLVLVLAAACGGDAAAPVPEAPPIPVRATEVTLSVEPERIRASGSLASASEVPLAFRIPGYVAEIVVEEGARVTAGRTLARLQMTEARAQLRAAEAQAVLAGRQLGRLERLLADSVVTLAQVDQARDAHERAQAGVELARFSLDNATIRAPGEGRVLRRLVEEAAFISAGQPAFHFASAAGGWVVRVGLPDREVTRIAVGSVAELRIAALGTAVLPGRVTEIADASDPRSGTFQVEITLDAVPEGAAGANLRSGLVAQVEIPLPGGEALAHLPLRSVVDAEADRGAVFVLEGDRARRQEVRIAGLGDGTVAVDAPGLVGRRVITDGAAYLLDGSAVEDRSAIPSDSDR